MGKLTRRGFVKRSGLAVGAAGALTVPFAGTAFGAAGIRKCVDIGAGSSLYSTPNMLNQVLATRTKWVRIWVLWDFAEPSPGNYNMAYLNDIDAQVFVARANGLNVMLVTSHFPQWANGTQGVPANYMEKHRAKPVGSGLKELIFGIPSGQLGAQGYWGNWIHFLIQKVKGYGGGVVLEIMNEPNFECWPQRDDSGQQITVAYKVAEMMHTAASINAFYGVPLAGPATSDSRANQDPFAATRFDEFTLHLKGALQYLNYSGDPRFRWSHHNYKDIEMGNTNGYSSVFGLINGWWNGWSTGGYPGIWITEGGARLGSTEVHGDLNLQANKVWGMYAIMQVASGAAMFSNYLLYPPPSANDDSALLTSSGTHRPVWQKFYDMAPNA